LSIDPVTTDANTGSSFNRYNYANNNPYKYFDPDGRSTNLVDRMSNGIISFTTNGGEGLSEGAVNAITGFGDGINILGFSPSKSIREGWDIEGGTDRCSPEYQASRDAGDLYSKMMPVAGRLGYISRVAGVPSQAATSAAAYTMRTAIKGEYRSILRPLFRLLDRDLKPAQLAAKVAKFGEAHTISRSGVTNKMWDNGIFGVSALNIGYGPRPGGDCECQP
jgi:hypothetical protein